MNRVLRIPLYSFFSADFVDGPDIRWICFEPSVWQQVVEFGAGDWKALCGLSEGSELLIWAENGVAGSQPVGTLSCE